jgi:hypothetical protein
VLSNVSLFERRPVAWDAETMKTPVTAAGPAARKS